MFPSVWLEGFGQQSTAIQSNFDEKCEVINPIWVCVGATDHVEQSLSWTQNNRPTCIKEREENQLL